MGQGDPQGHGAEPVRAAGAATAGLIHRFLQGFLVPSFTGSFVTEFRSKEAAQGWLYMRQLWQYTHPQSLTYAFMQDPLLSEEVLLAGITSRG